MSRSIIILLLKLLLLFHVDGGGERPLLLKLHEVQLIWACLAVDLAKWRAHAWLCQRVSSVQAGCSDALQSRRLEDVTEQGRAGLRLRLGPALRYWTLIGSSRSIQHGELLELRAAVLVVVRLERRCGVERSALLLHRRLEIVTFQMSLEQQLAVLATRGVVSKYTRKFTTRWNLGRVDSLLDRYTLLQDIV